MKALYPNLRILITAELMIVRVPNQKIGKAWMSKNIAFRCGEESLRQMAGNLMSGNVRRVDFLSIFRPDSIIDSC